MTSWACPRWRTSAMRRQNANCMKDGWFYTGDVDVMNPDGYLEIKERSNDIIINGGENISSVEGESVLYVKSAINEVAIVARPDEFWVMQKKVEDDETEVETCNRWGGRF
ncbi:hypothetical protein ACFX13_015429 [Malus domestica]